VPNDGRAELLDRQNNSDAERGAQADLDHPDHHAGEPGHVAVTKGTPRHASSSVAGSYPAAMSLRHKASTDAWPAAVIPSAVQVSEAI
jgi:hypothetical protein